MDTATAIAIAAPNAVAATAIYFGWRQHRDRLELDRRLTDLDNVRDVLDEAAVALHKGSYVLDDVRSGLSQWGAAYFTSEHGTDAYKKLGSLGEEQDALVERLSVRLGREAAVVDAFREAVEAALTVWRAAGRIRQEPESDGSESARAQIRTLNENTRDEIESQRTIFDGAREEFVAAANRTAGARL